MKKVLAAVTTVMLIISLSACSGGTGKSAGSSRAASSTVSSSAAKSEAASVDTSVMVALQVNVEGLGEVCMADDGLEPKFDEEFPIQSIAHTMPKNTRKVLSARPNEGCVFVKWKKDGKLVSDEPTINVTVSEDTEYIAVFLNGLYNKLPEGRDVMKETTMEKIGGLPTYGNSYNDDTFVFAFDLNDTIYRATAKMEKSVEEELQKLDLTDTKYSEKFAKAVAPLKITKIENATEMIPSQQELDKLVGKTGKDLLDDGWFSAGYMFDTMEFNMEHGLFEYIVVFDGTVKNRENFNPEEDLKPFVVKSVKYKGPGNIANIEGQ